MKVLSKLLMLALLVAAAAPAAAQDAKRIALSFDDVPRRPGGFMTPDQRAIALIAGLQKAGVKQAAFFVTTGNLEEDYGAGGEARIRAYAAAGHVIGNHSHTHTWLSRNTVTDYLADLDRAEAWLVDMPGKRPWYRFPYLDEGRDGERRDAVRAAIKQRGLKNAYVTIDNYDWAIDDLARQAVADGREIDMPALGALYVETVVGTADFYDRMARETLGRAAIQVILLHETDLNALFIADVVAGLQADGWTIVTMDEAYSDPIAQIEPDTLFLGGGRVSALAAAAGAEPDKLVYERTDEAELARLFEQRVMKKASQ